MRLPIFLIAAAVTCASACSSPDLKPYVECKTTRENDNDGPPDPGTTPELIVPNVDIGVDWYHSKAGFTVVYNAADEQSCFAALKLETSNLMITHSPATFDPPDDAIELRFIVEDVDAQYDKMKDDAELVRDIKDEEYGLRDFVVRDPYGFRVRFASPL
jgi:uncharacterized glyoxalase superfamily protein PhnB